MADMVIAELLPYFIMQGSRSITKEWNEFGKSKDSRCHKSNLEKDDFGSMTAVVSVCVPNESIKSGAMILWKIV